MTLRYLKVTQLDLQRQCYRAIGPATTQPSFLFHPFSPSVSIATADLHWNPSGTFGYALRPRNLEDSLQLSDAKIDLRLRRPDRRLLDVAQQPQNIVAGGKFG
jgi:hypothetical protein